MANPEKPKPAVLSEADIISRVKAAFPLRDPRVVAGIGDDAAVLRYGGAADTAPQLVVTTDLLVESVHFSLKIMSLADVGYKALLANLSDVAAMGGRPAQAFATLGVPARSSATEIESLIGGVQEATEYGAVSLVGGDTVAAPQWVLGFTVLGDLSGPPLLRSGARPGDNIWHSGKLGLSQTGLHMLWSGEALDSAQAAIAAHRRPAAPLALGLWLQREHLASACLDLSDSLSQCLLQLAEASAVGLTLDFAGYPFADAVHGFGKRMRRWRSGGKEAFTVPARYRPENARARYRCLAEYLLSSAEDYQLLFTAPPAATPRLLSESPLPLTRLGTVTAAAAGHHFRSEDGRTYKLESIGFEHL